MAHPPLENGKKTEGWQLRENIRVENKESRQLNLFKQKAGLWKKAAELAKLSHASMGIVVFSEAGKAFDFGSPSADAVLGCGGDVPDWEALRRCVGRRRRNARRSRRRKKRMTAVGDKVAELQRQTGKRFWWEVDPAALEEEDLPVFVRALRRIRDHVGRRVDNLQSTPPPQ